MSGNELLAAALRYAERGWPVLPLHDMSKGVCSCPKGEACKTPGKHPRLPKWQERASCDSGLIAGWWKQWPNANVGIQTGVRSGLIVLDVDPRHGGFDSLSELGLLPFPKTPIMRTGGGGVHLYFAHPGEPVNGFDLADGVEVKADGQYVVAAPSLTGEAP